MDTTELISLSRSGDTTRLTLRRPPLNFLSVELLRQFEAHLESFGESPACKALIIEAEGSAFSAGLEPSEHTKGMVFLLIERYHRVVQVLSSFPRPTIAMVRGLALGAGNELAAYCDFVLAAEKASFGQPEIKIGSLPSIAPLVLPPLIGQRRALEMILTGNLISAREAEKLGLINRALPEDQLPAAADDLVNCFRGLSVPVLELALQSIRVGRTETLDSHLRASESRYLNQLMDLEDSAEGMKAFLEKRIPQWKNR